MIRRRKAKSHIVEIVLVLVVFLVIYLANVLSHETLESEVTEKIEFARMKANPIAAEYVQESNAAD